MQFSRFDQVQIVTTKNIRYLSHPPQEQALPNGVWQVAGSVDGDLLLVKNSILLRIPATDVLKIVEYDINKVLNKLGNLYDGKIEYQEGKDTSS